MKQIVLEPTRNDVVLDLILTNDSRIITDYYISPPLGASNHNAVVFCMSNCESIATSNVKPLQPKMFIKWTALSLSHVQHYLTLIDWNNVFTGGSSPENVWQLFKQNIVNGIELYVSVVPLAHSFSRRSSRKTIHSRIISRLQAKRALLNTHVRSERSELESNIIHSIDIKQFHRYANSKLYAQPSFPSICKPNGTMASDSIEKALLFNSHFIKFFLRITIMFLPCLACAILATLCRQLSSLCYPLVKQLAKLKNSKSVSPDGFSSHTIKTLGHCLVHPLSMLFENLFIHEYVLLDWKVSIISPLYKLEILQSLGGLYDGLAFYPLHWC